MNHDIHNLLRCLQASNSHECLYIAYSGGLDSRLLAHIAQLNGIKVHLLHCTGPHIAPMDTRYACHWAQKRGLALSLLESNPLSLSAVAAGSKERCYACKHALFSLLLQHIDDAKLYDGTNHSDKQKFRPGMRALQELGIISPFALCDIDKDSIRRLAMETGLEDPEQAARPCLLTRFPYDTRPQKAILERIATAKESIHDYCMQARGMQNTFDFRLRYIDEPHFVLHIAMASDAETLHAHEHTALNNILLSHGIEATIVPVSTLSGFFDMKFGLQQ